MRAPQYRRVTGPNPALKKGLRVEPFANIFAVVEGLGVISLHKTRQEADAALADRAKPHEAKAQN